MLFSASPSPSLARIASQSEDFCVRRSSRLVHGSSRRISSRRRSITVASVNISVDDVAQVFENKVLISAALACSIGQLSKPFTSALSGNGLDLGAVIRSGGMPSTHSAGVMAATTCLGLERGFSDPIFGVSAIFALFVMYDAQGVRREVGRHAKNLNKMAMLKRERSRVFQEKTNLVGNYARSASPSLESVDGADQEQLTIDEIGFNRLEESVGHTEVQVIAGAILGFLVSFGVELLLS
ncbi:acid phosphatase/vanadium-dependent haloperoxidase-related protein [Wolffia australiana]